MFTRFLSRFRRAGAPVRSAPRAGAPRLTVEALEPREVPAIVYGLTAGNELYRFDSANPNAILGGVGISGLQTGGERVIGIDFRPRTGELYATTAPLGSTTGATLRTYVVNPNTGAATFVGATSALSNAGDRPTGYDFNPTVDRIRVVQSNDENGRLNPTNGNLAGNDTDLTYVAPATGPIVAVAYDRNFDRLNALTIRTTLYGIDAGTSALVVQGGINGSSTGGPNAGVIDSIGALGVIIDPGSFVGFDIGAGGANGGLGNALAVFPVGNTTALYSIDLATGSATLIGNIGDGVTALTDIAIAPDNTVVVGSGAGAVSDVRALDSATGAVRAAAVPFDGFAGGVRVAAGDLNGDGVADAVVTAIVPQGHVKAFDGTTGAQLAGPLGSFFAYAGFVGTVNVAVGDVNGDGFGDIITAANGGSGHVKAFSGADGSLLLSFFAYMGFGGDVTVAAGDFDADGRDEVVTVAAAQGHVKVFAGNGSLYTSPNLPGSTYSFFTFVGFPGLVNVAAGDVTGDGRADLIVASGPGTNGHIKVFNGTTGTMVSSFFAFAPGAGNGAFVALADANGDGSLELRVTPGPGALADVTTFDPFGRLLGITFPAFAGFGGGATVAGSRG